MAAKRGRLDQLCVLQGLCSSRQRAQALIRAGQVLVDGQVSTKPGTAVPAGASLELRASDHPFVSRGGLKLRPALEAFEIEVQGQVALDVGASTGGFTDCLLQQGARHVVAVDVGYGQLHYRLRQDRRVTCLERCNARYLQPETVRRALLEAGVQQMPRLATVDVSFISLTLVLPAVGLVLGPGRPVVALIKPQFEARRCQVARGGVVRDPGQREQAIGRVLGWARQQGWGVGPGLDSPIPGPKGNVEHLVALTTP